MINLREEALKQAKGMEYLKLRVFGTGLPSYAFRNVHEFTNKRELVRVSETVVIPRVVYYPHPETNDEQIALPIKLQDGSGEVGVYVRPMAFNVEAGKWMIDSLAELRQGDLLVYAILLNGYQEPGILGCEGKRDDRLYLSGFWSPRIRKPKSPLFDLVSKLSDLIPDVTPSAEPVPVRI